MGVISFILNFNLLRNMKVFIKKIIVFIFTFGLITMLLIQINNYVLNSYVFKTKPQVNKLILGSSTTECAINDNIFKNSINMSISAEPIFYSYLKMKKIIELNPNIDTVILAISPKSITTEIDKNWLYNSEHFTSRIGNYFFLMNENDKKTLISHFRNEYYYISYANVVLRAYRNMKEYLVGDIKEIYGGYAPLKRDKLKEALKRLDTQDKRRFFPSQVQFKYLDKFENYSKLKNIKIIFISTPIRKEYVEKNKNLYFKFDSIYVNRYSHIKHLDYTNFKLPDSAYADLFHLNQIGSTIFSNHLNKNFKQHMLNQTVITTNN